MRFNFSGIGHAPNLYYRQPFQVRYVLSESAKIQNFTVPLDLYVGLKRDRKKLPKYKVYYSSRIHASPWVAVELTQFDIE